MIQKLSVTLSAIMLHLAIGSVYAWSVLVHPIMNQTGWSLTAVSIVFSITILCLGFSAMFLGKRIRETRPSFCVLAVIILFTVGMWLSGLAVEQEIYPLLILGYGVIVGIATGIAYLLPIPILMTWYPHNKGTATGLIVMGFGFSSLLVSKLYVLLMSEVSLSSTFILASLALVCLMIPALFFLREQKSDKEESTKQLHIEDKAINAVKTDTFKVLWIIFFINIFVGIACLSALAPMQVELFNVDPADAALFVGLIGVVNGVSRIFWAWLSDMITCPLTFVILIACQMVAIISMIYWYDLTVFQACVITIISGYGGMFAVMPAYVADIFGMEKLTDNLGKMLSAWALAGLLGPVSLAIVKESTGEYGYFFLIAIHMVLINCFLSMWSSEKDTLHIR